LDPPKGLLLKGIRFYHRFRHRRAKFREDGLRPEDLPLDYGQDENDLKDPRSGFRQLKAGGIDNVRPGRKAGKQQAEQNPVFEERPPIHR
jgi:hypothetical protein